MNGTIRNPNYKPSRFKKCKMLWENTLYMGVELELEKDPSCEADISDTTVNLNSILTKLKNNIFYYKRDSSLTSKGIEMVSHPFTLQYAHNKLKLKRIFNVIKEMKLQDTDNCGLHIHLNKKFFTKKELYKLRLFFSINHPKIIKFSRRKKD